MSRNYGKDRFLIRVVGHSANAYLSYKFGIYLERFGSGPGCSEIFDALSSLSSTLWFIFGFLLIGYISFWGFDVMILNVSGLTLQEKAEAAGENGNLILAFLGWILLSVTFWKLVYYLLACYEII